MKGSGQVCRRLQAFPESHCLSNLFSLGFSKAILAMNSLKHIKMFRGGAIVCRDESRHQGTRTRSSTKSFFVRLRDLVSLWQDGHSSLINAVGRFRSRKDYRAPTSALYCFLIS